MSLLAIAAVALAGIALFILGESSTSLMMDADRAHVEAASRNLAASALAWAQLHRSEARPAADAREVRLDASPLNAAGAAAAVKLLSADDEGPVRAQIATQCRRGRFAPRRTATYALPPVP